MHIFSAILAPDVNSVLVLPQPYRRGYDSRQLHASLPRSFNQLLYQHLDRCRNNWLGIRDDGLLYHLFLLLSHDIDVEGSFHSQIDPIRSRFIGGRRAHSERESWHISSVTFSRYTLKYILHACFLSVLSIN